MSVFGDDFVQNQRKGRPMLEQTEWIKINKSCYTLIDGEQRVLATIFTSYDEDDGDEFLIWDVEMEDEPFGSFVSLYSAKIAVQKAIAEWEEKQYQKKKPQTKKKVVKKDAVRKK